MRNSGIGDLRTVSRIQRVNALQRSESGIGDGVLIAVAYIECANAL